MGGWKAPTLHVPAPTDALVEIPIPNLFGAAIVAGWGCGVRVGSRDRKCEWVACLPLRRGKVCCVASIALTMGRGEAVMTERVDPRRAQVAQVGVWKRSLRRLWYLRCDKGGGMYIRQSAPSAQPSVRPAKYI